jgi:hypothetical protein
MQIMKLIKLPTGRETVPKVKLPVGIQGGKTLPGPGQAMVIEPDIIMPSAIVDIRDAIIG